MLKNLFNFKPKHYALLFCVLLLLALVFYQWFDKTKTPPNDVTLIPPDLFISILSVNPSLSENGLIPQEAYFTVETSEPVDDTYILKNLIMEPALEMTINKLSDTTYKMIPKEVLPPGYVLSFTHRNSDRVAGWAFQVSDDLRVKSIYPAFDASSVPTNSTIELTFSFPIDESIVNYLTIQPAVDFRHRVVNNRLILQPTVLEEDVRYSVALKEGYSSPLGSTMSLPYTSHFMTSGSTGVQQDVLMTMSLISSETTPLISVNYYNASGVADAKIYRIDKGSDYIKLAQDFNESQKYYRYPHKRLDLSAFEEVFSDKVETFEHFYRNYYALPVLVDGYYIVLIENKNTAIVEFLQVSPYQLYYENSNEHTLLWALDGRTGSPIVNAPVKINSQEITKTDANGTATVAGIPSQTISLHTETQEIYLPLATGRYPYYSFYDAYYRDSTNQIKSEVDQYKSFLYSDRPVYRPNDTIEVFGMLAYKDLRVVDTLRLELRAMGKIIESKEVSLTDFRTYNESFQIENSPYDSYLLVALKDNREIAKRYIEISNYEKPEFTINAQLDKSILGPGESLTLSGDVLYYDETPVSESAFNIDGYAYSNTYFSGILGNITTDAHGAFKAEITPEIPYKSSLPFFLTVSLVNRDAEKTDVTHRSTIQVFPSQLILDATLNTTTETGKLTMDISTRALRLPNAQVDPYALDTYSGEAINQEVRISLFESYYDRIEKGERYNEHLKITEKIYDYKHIRNEVLTATESTQDGKLQLLYDYKPERSYELIVKANDKPNHSINVQAYHYGFEAYSDSSLPLRPTLKYDYILDVDQPYSIALEFPQEESLNDNTALSKTLFVTYQGNYLNHRVSADHTYSGTFKESDMPNLILKAIYFDGKSFQIGSQPPSTMLRMNPADKELSIKISTDKENYQPGDMMTINLKTTHKGKVIPAEVIINVVDEAYYGLYEDNILAYNEFYTPIYNTGITTFYHTDYINTDSMAEMGEGGSEGFYLREDFKDTANFSPLRTSSQGEGSLTLKLPDNTTSWRITAHGISENLDVGTLKTNRVSTLPFYARFIMGETYLVGESPALILRSGGADVKPNTSVSYAVALEDSKGNLTNFTAQGLPNHYTRVALPELKSGQYKLTLYATQGDLKDALVHTFNVIESRIHFDAQRKTVASTEYTLKNPDAVSILTLWHQKALDLSGLLWQLTGNSQERLEWLLATTEVNRLLTSIGEDGLIQGPKPDLLSPFISYNGGIKPLVNAEDDLRLTLDVTSLESSYLNRETLKSYFNFKIDDAQSSMTTRLLGLWGLSMLREPVLYDLYAALELLPEHQDIEVNKIILAQAFASLGAYENAFALYNEFSEIAPLDFIENQTDKSLYFDLANLGADFKLESANAWYKLATENLPKQHVYQLKQLKFLKSKTLALEPITLNYTLNNDALTLILDSPWPNSLAIHPGDAFKIQAIQSEQGDTLTIEETFKGNLTNTSMTNLPGYAINRTLSSDTVNLSERIELVFTVNHPINQGYTLIQPIPSGFTVVSPQWPVQNNQILIYGYSQGGSSVQKIILKAKQSGTFTLEPAILTGNRIEFMSVDSIKLTVH